MKKILIAFLLLTGVAAQAQHFPQHYYGHGHHHGQWRHSGSGWVWVVPTIVGGVIGYEMAKNQPAPPQPIIIQTPTGTQECSPWTETINPDGTVTKTRTCK